MPKIDTPEVKAVEATKSTRQYITIPERDVLDFPFPAIRVNNAAFYPGKTYEIEEPLATTVKERIKTWMRQTLRLMQPKKDSEAENIMIKEGTARGGEYTTNFGGE